MRYIYYIYSAIVIFWMAIQLLSFGAPWQQTLAVTFLPICFAIALLIRILAKGYMSLVNRL